MSTSVISTIHCHPQPLLSPPQDLRFLPLHRLSHQNPNPVTKSPPVAQLSSTFATSMTPTPTKSSSASSSALVTPSTNARSSTLATSFPLSPLASLSSKSAAVDGQIEVDLESHYF
ncbi:unnamed protein product [Camellia sinensis]